MRIPDNPQQKEDFKIRSVPDGVVIAYQVTTHPWLYYFYYTWVFIPTVKSLDWEKDLVYSSKWYCTALEAFRAALETYDPKPRNLIPSRNFKRNPK